MKQQIVRVTAIKLQICNFLSILCLSAPLREKNSPPTAVFRLNDLDAIYGDRFALQAYETHNILLAGYFVSHPVKEMES